MEDKIKNKDLDKPSIRDKIIKYYHNNFPNTKTEYKYIKSEKDLNYIRENNYLICPQMSGVRVIVIFFREKNRYYAVNFHKDKLKRNNIQIYPIEIPVIEKFYNGTIMEGIYFKFDKKKFLIIDQIYKLYGEDQTMKSRSDRIFFLSRKLKTDIIINPEYTMLTAQLYSIDKRSLEDLYEKIKINPNIRELAFVPNDFEGTVYLYSIISSDLIDDIVKYSKLIIQKTKTSDVYHLLDTVSRKRIGIAHIPDMKTSKMCKEWFKTCKKKELVVRCLFDSVKNTWIPIEKEN
jgi:hypothetical protein